MRGLLALSMEYFAIIRLKTLQNSSAIKKNFCDFAFGKHSGKLLLLFLIKHLKCAIFSANYKIYKQLKFIELTLNKKENPYYRNLLFIHIKIECAIITSGN